MPLTDVATRAFFLNYILCNMEEYLLTMPYPDIIGMLQRVENNKCPESHLIHARALYNFFYDKKPKEDDIHCNRDYNYVPKGNAETCRAAINRINKGLAHITTSKGINYPWGREVCIKLEALLVPEIQGFLQYIEGYNELRDWLNAFNEFNYEARIKALLERCDSYPLMNIN